MSPKVNPRYKVYQDRQSPACWVYTVADGLMVPGTLTTSLASAKRQCARLNQKAVNLNVATRSPVRGHCEKCATPTNWQVDIFGLPTYWCGC